ncbi:2-Cys peroxiredoxin BAS1, putative [Entamoeba invadens IP1]|uniref:2-Cys peroxiredoxin BAS1, putative n=1 Tax=Entamoeba invadens IP1 TaxID=370355 RepID=A0A0A1TVZ1_ENTIV|nr:2-Cys peroxiredoxin BAS1, putative [Entamoeba invadens IP1]ELP84667.1 2-Cys peroxiredoxin BAS1, putative [Entamoeba invadens IP1]|eukprot:XP_004184013.1 2-Cys peroxiredoxin BAS1, putative [Entamoeba invadens IP1]
MCEKECPAKKAYEDFLRIVPKVQVGEEAPEIKAQCLCPCGAIKDFDMSEYKGKFIVLLFYPLDWTFVCPTEMMGYSKLAEEMKDVQFEHGGVGKLSFPLVSDIKKCISMRYNMYNAADGIARLGYVIVDTKGIVRYMQVNDNGIGRNTDETKRIIEAIKFSDEHGDVCPLNWKPGKDTMKPTPEGVAAYLTKH